MIAELVAVGTEILLGNIVNTNSAYLSEKCAQLGLSVYYESVVGDNRDRMKAVIASALDRSDVVILSGGLGPTEDDLTKEVCAEVMGLPLSEDPHSRKRIERYMKEYKNDDLHIGDRIIYTTWVLYPNEVVTVTKDDGETDNPPLV